MTANTNTNETKRQRGRKVAALLAGGLVLGVGTMATLASWNDSEYASATFSAGRFNLEGSTNGTAWDDHIAAPGAPLSFTAPFNNLTPTDVVYAPFAIRLAANTTNDATVTITASSSGTVTNLNYKLVKSTSMSCDAAAIAGGTTLVNSSAVGAATGAVTFDVTKGSPTTSAGETAFLCFQVTAGTGLAQGQTGSGTWQFQAVSK